MSWLKKETRRPFLKGRRAIGQREVVSVSDYPQIPHPKERDQRMAKMTTMIIHISSFFIIAPPLQTCKKKILYGAPSRWIYISLVMLLSFKKNKRKFIQVHQVC